MYASQPNETVLRILEWLSAFNLILPYCIISNELLFLFPVPF